MYQLAADMGGAGYIFTGENDADIMHNSALINLNVLEACRNRNIKRVYYSSSACMYPEHNQLDPENPNCAEESAYPANPDSEYGWEKLFSERLYLAFNRNYGMQCRVARYHNIFGPLGTWQRKRKSTSCNARKVAMCPDGGEIEVWGDITNTILPVHRRMCKATVRIMRSHVDFPLNIGSEEMIRINDLAQMAIDISDKNITIRNIPGPEGVRGRNSDNTLIKQHLEWSPSMSLRHGMERAYTWIASEVERQRFA